MTKNKWSGGNLIKGPSLSTKVDDQRKILKDKNGKAYGYLWWLGFAKKALNPITGVMFRSSEKKVRLNNTTLDKSLIQKLNRSRMGSEGAFYLTLTGAKPAKRWANVVYSSAGCRAQITTYTGIIVSEIAYLRGRVVTFSYEGKLFRGYVKKGVKLFTFKRVG
jgi:hypothetical protein